MLLFEFYISRTKIQNPGKRLQEAKLSYSKKMQIDKHDFKAKPIEMKCLTIQQVLQELYHPQPYK